MATNTIDLEIPIENATSYSGLLDSIKEALINIESKLDHGIFLRGPEFGLSIKVLDPIDGSKDGFHLVRVEYEGIYPKM